MVLKQEVCPGKESKRPRTSEEVAFELAITTPRIVNEELETLKGALRQVFFLIGLRAEQIPADEEKGFLIQYIVENYGGHTADEIKLAFKMAIQGKLKIDNKDVKCYGIFSPMYFTTVMDAYREWAREQIILLDAPEIPKEPSVKEKAVINLEYAGFLLNLLKNGLLPPLK
jgi:hypothetical protein